MAIASLSISLTPGAQNTIVINTIVPLSSQKGDMNVISIKTTSDEGILISKGTKLIVQEIANLDIIEYNYFSASAVYSRLLIDVSSS